jgi:hypothetical protein
VCEKRIHETIIDIVEFIDEHDGDLSDGAGGTLPEVYGLLYERFRPGAEAAIAEKEAALDKMLEDYRALPPTLRERTHAMMEAMQAEIDALRGQLTDLREPWGNLKQQLTDRKKAYDHAAKMLGKDGVGRQKTDALQGVIKQVVCWFRHTAPEGLRRKGVTGRDNNGKSYLDRVEIVPISGDKWAFTSFTRGSRPGPD